MVSINRRISSLSDADHYERDRLSQAQRDEKYLSDHTAKRLVVTSPTYPSLIEAVDAAAANRSLPFCDYVYVTGDNRVVGIYDYFDVTPNQPVPRGQRRVLIPANF
jgi:hypothetical protein